MRRTPITEMMATIRAKNRMIFVKHERSDGGGSSLLGCEFGFGLESLACWVDGRLPIVLSDLIVSSISLSVLGAGSGGWKEEST